VWCTNNLAVGSGELDACNGKGTAGLTEAGSYTEASSPFVGTRKVTDFALAKGSDAVDEGADSGFAWDALHQHRPIGSKRDPGAFER
jgi:hypothetical protein